VPCSAHGPGPPHPAPGEPGCGTLHLRAVSPRFGPDFFVYLSSRSGADGLWRYQAGTSAELWAPTEGGNTSTPAVGPGGREVAFVSRRQGRGRLYLMPAAGAAARVLAESLDVRGAPSFSPDSKWIAVTASEGAESSIFKVPVDGGAPVRLTKEISSNPVWSPDGKLIVYSGPQVGILLTVKAMTPDGVAVPLPNLHVRSLGERYRFTPHGKSLVLQQGPFRDREFWLLDLATGKLRQLTDLKGGDAVNSFDVSPDGKQILFDRLRENSDIVLIDIPQQNDR